MTPDTTLAPDAAPRGRPWAWVLAALTLITWQRAFTTYFAQDDFRWLLKAAGDDPAPLWAPRFLSMHLFFRTVAGLTGPDAVIFHALGIAFFLATGLIFYWVLARYVRPGPAAATAALWLSSPAVFAALHWSSAVSDLMCALFLAGCVLLLVQDRPGGERLRWAAPLLFGLALASKEIAVGAVPVLTILDWKRGNRAGRFRAALYVGLAAVAAAIALGPTSVATGQAYGVAPLAVLRNLPAYLAVSVFAGAAAHSGSDIGWARQVWVQVAGWVLLAAWLVLLIRRRSDGAWLGALWFLGLLGPVLPLERQFYFYYVLCALPGLYASAILLAVGGGRASHMRALAVGCTLLVTAQVAAVQVRHGARLPNAALPRDFVLRRAQVARNALKDLDASDVRIGPRVVLLGEQPVETSAGTTVTTALTAYDIDPYWDDNVWVALAEGDALRWRVPRIQEAEFQRWLGPKYRDWTVLTFDVDGHLRVHDYASYSGVSRTDTARTLAARLARADRFMVHRVFPAALEELEVAARMAPENANLQLNVGTLQAMMGDTTAAVRAIASVVERFPHHPAARYNLGLLYWRTGRRAEAQRAWEPLFAESPETDLARAIRELMDGRRR